MILMDEMSSVWVIACTVEVNGPGLLTDHHVLFQSGMLTFQITSPSIRWALRRRMRTLTIVQKVRRDDMNETSNRAERLTNNERCLLKHTHTRTHTHTHAHVHSGSVLNYRLKLIQLLQSPGRVEEVRVPKCNPPPPLCFRQSEQKRLKLFRSLWFLVGSSNELRTVNFK